MKKKTGRKELNWRAVGKQRRIEIHLSKAKAAMFVRAANRPESVTNDEREVLRTVASAVDSAFRRRVKQHGPFIVVHLHGGVVNDVRCSESALRKATFVFLGEEEDCDPENQVTVPGLVSCIYSVAGVSPLGFAERRAVEIALEAYANNAGNRS